MAIVAPSKMPKQQTAKQQTVNAEDINAKHETEVERHKRRRVNVRAESEDHTPTAKKEQRRRKGSMRRGPYANSQQGAEKEDWMCRPCHSAAVSVQCLVACAYCMCC